MLDEFGPKRVWDSPISEAGFAGLGVGAAMVGLRPIIEMMTWNFGIQAFDQIINHAAKMLYMSGGQYHVPMVLRGPNGAAHMLGSQHSQSVEHMLATVPGLKVISVGTPYDAKGLLTAAIEDPNPIMVFEHKFLYRSVREEIPDEYYTVEIGNASVPREGTDISIITYGLGVHWALEYAENHSDVSIEVIDLRTLLPLDEETIYASVKKTGKAIVLHEDCMTGGIGGELVARITEHCFQFLDAPVKRVASLDTPVPFAAKLEEQFLPKERLDEVMNVLLSY